MRLCNCRFVENQSSVNYKSLVGSNEFTIHNDGNWSEDIQFELQTSNWNDEKKFKIIVNGKTVVEKVCVTVFPVFLFFFFSLHKTQLKYSRNSFSEPKLLSVTSKLSITKTLTWEIFDLTSVNRLIRALKKEMSQQCVRFRMDKKNVSVQVVMLGTEKLWNGFYLIRVKTLI